MAQARGSFILLLGDLHSALTYTRPFPEARYCAQSGRTSIGRLPHSLHLRRHRAGGSDGHEPPQSLALFLDRAGAEVGTPF
jgi:hypothetical protein